MSQPAVAELTPFEVEYLHDFVRGMNRRQMKLKYGLTLGQLETQVKHLYFKLDVHDLGISARAYALSVAIKRFGLLPPPELLPAIELISNGQFRFDGEHDESILGMCAEGYLVVEIIAAHNNDAEMVRDRLAAMRTGTGLSPFPPFSVACAALWARVLNITLNRTFVIRPQDKELIRGLILGRSSGSTASTLGISHRAAKDRVTALEHRVGVRTEVDLVMMAIENGWVKPADSSDLEDRAAWLQEHGLSQLELRIVRMLSENKSRQQVAVALGEELTESIGWVFKKLYRHVGLTDDTVTAKPSAVVGLVAIAGWPLEQERKEDPYSEQELDLLVKLALGKSGRQIAADSGVSVSTAGNWPTRLYAKMGVKSGPRAVALAARDGLINGELLAALAEDFPAKEQFSWHYISYIRLIANGGTMSSEFAQTGATSLSDFNLKVLGDRKLTDLPLFSQVAVMVWLNYVEVEGPVLPDSPASREAVATEEPPSKQPAPAPLPTPKPRSQILDPLAELRRMARVNRTDKAVDKGTKALTKNLGRLVTRPASYQLLIAAIRSGEFERPWMNPELIRRLTERKLKPDVVQFLELIADGASVEEARTELAKTKPDAADSHAFHVWYARYACAPLTAAEPRDAAAIALWLGLIKLGPFPGRFAN